MGTEEIVLDTNMSDSEIKLKDHKLQAWFDQLHTDFLESAKCFEEQDVHNSIVFFGSSKIMPWKDAQEQMRNVEILFDNSKRRTEKQWEQLDDASNLVYMSRYYDAAEELAFMFSEWSNKFKTLKNRYHICSGGGPGIMEAANKGASRAGSPSIGLGIDLDLEQDKNAYVTPELRFLFNNFLIRKFWFFHFVRAIVIFPGGMGTLDELAEILTLIQTKKVTRYIPVVLYGSDFWGEVMNFEPMVRYNTIEERDLLKFHYSDDAFDTFNFITHELKKSRAARRH